MRISSVIGPLLLVGMVGIIVGSAFGSANPKSYNAIGAGIVATLLAVGTLPIFSRMQYTEADAGMRRLLGWALILKLIGGVVRYYVVFTVYGGDADASAYHLWALKLAPEFRSGHFTASVGTKLVGTGFVRYLTGLIYLVTGPSKLAGFVFYSWLGFWGLYFFYRAFCIAFPIGDRRRYAYLVFFLPSLLFWPSSIGKEAWMMFALGIAVYGAARVLRRLPGGFLIGTIGGLGTAMVRPHVTLVFLIGFIAAYAFRRTPDRASAFGPIPKAIGLLVLIVVMSLVLRQSQEFLNVDSFSSSSLQQVRTSVSKNTSEGGSKFQTAQKGGLSSLPLATLSLLFRPFPWETHSPQGLFASLEGVLLMVLTIRGYKRWRHFPKLARDYSYLIFAAVYSLMFIYAFSVVGNFGIISRQRVQLYPIFLVLLCLPLPDAEGEPEPYASAISVGAVPRHPYY
jgi:hypothetical protein